MKMSLRFKSRLHYIPLSCIYSSKLFELVIYKSRVYFYNMVLVLDYDMHNFVWQMSAYFVAHKDVNKYCTLPFVHKHGTSDFFRNVPVSY
jgi:hypothetical protein